MSVEYAPPVLKPGLDLGVGQAEFGRKLLTILDTQVLLLVKGLFLQQMGP